MAPAFTCDADCAFDTNRTRAHLLHHVTHAIPTVIHCSDIDLIPRRIDFIDETLRRQMHATISTGKPVLFMPNDVTETIRFNSGKMRSVFVIYGILPIGLKVSLVLTNLPIYVSVRVPDDWTLPQFTSLLTGELAGKGINYLSTNTTQMEPMLGFHEGRKDTYLRIMFSTLFDRKRGIECISRMNSLRVESGQTKFDTADDDTSRLGYYNMIARVSGFSCGDWNRVTGYTMAAICEPNVDYTIEVNIAKYEPLDPKLRATLNEGALENYLQKTRMHVCSWDIETYNTTGGIPKVEEKDWSITAICTQWFWQTSAVPHMGICCCDMLLRAREGVPLTIVCDDETGILSAQHAVYTSMRPDIMEAFNSGNFDWPMWREKCRRAGLLGELRKSLSCAFPYDKAGTNPEANVIKFGFVDEVKVKIDAENNHEMTCAANFPGVLDIDIMPIFLSMNTRMEVPKLASLNFFLQYYKLESKEDMPISRMFRIVERSRHFATEGYGECHCDSLCDVCTTHVPWIDHIIVDGAATSETLPAICGNCCFCDKYQQNLDDVADLAYYCMIDSLRTQQLMAKVVVVADKQAVAQLARINLHAAFYRAGGMKVQNFIGSIAAESGHAFSNRSIPKGDHEKEHFEGGKLFPPILGRNTEAPVGAIDVNSLYPTMMFIFNLSYDRIVTEEAEARRLETLGYNMLQIGPFNYEIGEKKGTAGNKHCTGVAWSVRHNGVMSESDQHIVDHFAAKLICNGDTYSVAELENVYDFIDQLPGIPQITYDPIPGRAALPGESMGILPRSVLQIFNRRKPIKKEWLYYGDLRKKMEDEKLATIECRGRTLSYAEIVFMHLMVNTAQNALKLLANTAYGVSGTFRSAIYNLYVAAGITYFGRDCITRVGAFVTHLGFRIQYGDTDSQYLKPPDKLITDKIAAYEAAQEALTADYAEQGVENVPRPEPDTPEAEFKAARVQLRIAHWAELVALSEPLFKKLLVKISYKFMDHTGTTFFAMSLEEFGMPSSFVGKKKYFMYEHGESVNFYPVKPFIRGIDIIKKGQSAIAKLLGMEYMMEVLSPECELSPLVIIREKIAKFYDMPIVTKNFILSAKYKPQKKNLAVLNFIKRMRETIAALPPGSPLRQVYVIPEPGDTFKYVVVRKSTTFTLRGRKIEPSKADQMEFVDVYTHSLGTAAPMEIDISYYMLQAMLTLFARFVCGENEDFRPTEGKYDRTINDEYEKYDKELIKCAAKYIHDLCDEIAGNEKTQAKLDGAQYRKQFNRLDKQLRADATVKGGRVGSFVYDLNKSMCYGSVNDIIQYAQGIITAPYAPTGRTVDILLRHYTVYEFTRLYMRRNKFGGGIYKDRLEMIDAEEKKLIKGLYDLAPQVVAALNHANMSIEAIVNGAREFADTTLSVADLDRVNVVVQDESVAAFHKMVQRGRATHIMRLDIKYNMEYIMTKRAKAIGDVVAPADPPKRIAAADTQRIVRGNTISDFQW